MEIEMKKKSEKTRVAYEGWLKVLGRSIARRRKQLGWTQAKTAENSGFDLKFYQDLEYGRRPCSTRTLFTLAKGMKTTIKALVVDAEKGK